MLKQFFSLLGRYIRPYRKYLTWAVILNFVSQWLNVFSFAAIIPILNILFKIDKKAYEYQEWDWSHIDKDVLINNASWWINNFITEHGAFLTLVMLGGLLIFMTMLKTAGYFASSAVMVPLRTGIVRDIRVEVYNKVLRLPLSFFSEERKGDIIARMSADVTAVENSLTSSIDMLLRNPIALIIYFSTLFTISWQMTLFVIVVLPFAGWVMGVVSRKLKRQSSTAQAQWGDIMSQLDETLGGLRIIKAFLAEGKMSKRFTKTNDDYRKAMNEMVIRQSSAHPMSEFLGTCVIVIVLWFGGSLILNTDYAPIDAATFIFYMVILYSIINPLKEFAKAFYNVPMGLASMDRIDMILKAENPIKEPAAPLPLTSFEDKIEFRNVGFSYVEGRPVLKHIDLTVPKGKTIALVGQSGSGKSTLVDLVPRYHDISEGQLLIDGKDVARPHRQRQPGGHPLQRHLLQQHHLRRGERHHGAGHRSGQDCQRPRLHHGDGAGLRHDDRRPRRTPVRRAAPACQHRPGHPEEPAHPHPGRSHLGPRHRERTPGARSPGAPDEVAHHHRHRPPPEHYPQRGRNLRHARRRNRGTRHARRADCTKRVLQETE